MSRFVSLCGEKKTKRAAQLVQAAASFFYIGLLLAIILYLLFIQFGPRIRIFLRILRNSRRYWRFSPVIRPHPFKDSIISPATQVVFTESQRAELSICFKMWQRRLIRGEVANEIHYLLEGFICNQRFAPGVYLGFAYFKGLSEDAKIFQHGFWVLLPRRSKLAYGKYAYVMKALQDEWKLDKHLYAEEEPLATQAGMMFLAKEVARIHRVTKKSHLGKGLPASIEEKLKFNINAFEETLNKLFAESIDIDAYQAISAIMKQALIALVPHFQGRFEQGHIRRCHGDLKLTNLWIRPASQRYAHPRLLALDCIDFNPTYCHIDTLSDVAMLAMDLQMYLAEKDHYLVEVFITAYLQEMAEDERIARPLLLYYITEKAIVCTNVSILLDGDSARGKKYLSLALQQARELQYFLPSSKEQDKVIQVAEIADTPQFVTPC